MFQQNVCNDTGRIITADYHFRVDLFDMVSAEMILGMV